MPTGEFLQTEERFARQALRAALIEMLPGRFGPHSKIRESERSVSAFSGTAEEGRRTTTFVLEHGHIVADVTTFCLAGQWTNGEVTFTLLPAGSTPRAFQVQRHQVVQDTVTITAMEPVSM